MFSFNFLDDPSSAPDDMQITPTMSPTVPTPEHKAKLIDIPPTMCNFDGIYVATNILSYNIYTVLRPDVSNYDLIPDLAKYVLDTGVRGSVLELGCGHGVPGMCALLQGCHPVVFSDFNDYVIKATTWPNIMRNCSHLSHLVKCYAGDWMLLSQELLQGNLVSPLFYDVILTAETLYNLDCCTQVFNLIDKHLAHHGQARAFIASKRYYFGVGGGTEEFMRLVVASRTLQCEVVKVFEDGVSNIREIIAVRRSHDSC